MFRRALRSSLLLQQKQQPKSVSIQGIFQCFSGVAAQATEEKVLYKPLISDIKKLREASQAPMNDCKKALVESKGDFPLAFEWLRKKGMATAVAKSGRDTYEGLVGVSVNGTTGAVVELNSETDFVSRNELFHNFLRKLSSAATGIETSSEGKFDLEKLLQHDYESAHGAVVPMSTGIDELIGKVGENISLRRADKIQVQDGMICSYVHNVASSGMGGSCALVAVEFASQQATELQKEAIDKMGRRLAMHIVVSKPLYLSKETVPSRSLENEKRFLLEQIQDSGKPQNILDKMVEGRIGKYYSEYCLLEQGHMLEPGNPKILQLLEETSKKLGIDFQIKGFLRYQVGETTTNTTITTTTNTL